MRLDFSSSEVVVRYFQYFKVPIWEKGNRVTISGLICPYRQPKLNQSLISSHGLDLAADRRKSFCRLSYISIQTQHSSDAHDAVPSYQTVSGKCVGWTFLSQLSSLPPIFPCQHLQEHTSPRAQQQRIPRYQPDNGSRFTETVKRWRTDVDNSSHRKSLRRNGYNRKHATLATTRLIPTITGAAAHLSASVPAPLYHHRGC